MLKSFYTVTNQDDHFVYFDLGCINFDKKLPRRSGSVATKPEARKLLQKAKDHMPELIDSHKHIKDYAAELRKMEFKIIHVQYKEVK